MTIKEAKQYYLENIKQLCKEKDYITLKSDLQLSEIKVLDDISLPELKDMYDSILKEKASLNKYLKHYNILKNQNIIIFLVGILAIIMTALILGSLVALEGLVWIIFIIILYCWVVCVM